MIRRVNRYGLIVFNALLVVGVITLGALWITKPTTPKAPLVYPLQKVLEVTEDTVKVRGTKCNTSDRPVGITGDVYWQSVNPRGTSIYVFSGSRVLDPGCETTVFENQIPLSVQNFTNEQYPRRVRWIITGKDTAENGGTKSWQTEEFSLIGGVR